MTDADRICPTDGGSHAWGRRDTAYLCARPISKSVTIETGTCGKCGVTRAVTRNAAGEAAAIQDTPGRQGGVTVQPSSAR